jgi:SDR family mycofactocin-dependent oxidoreductase
VTAGARPPPGDPRSSDNHQACRDPAARATDGEKASSQMTGRVEGKVAFITGAARGQGRSHAVRLAQEGADIIAVDVCKNVSGSDAIPGSTPEDLAETADLVKNLGRRIVTAEVDVRDYDRLEAAVNSGVEQLGRLDIIAANAGIGNGGETLDKLGEQDWQTMIDINLAGVWKTVKAGVPHILAGGNGGSIILTSSVGGLKAYPNVGHYAAAKHGMVGLMRAFALELGQHSIRVNSVHPTNVNTPMFMNEGTMKMFRPDLENPTVADFEPVAKFMHVLPIGWVEPVDISNAVLFLASDEARYITGLTMTVDGGTTLK